MSEAVAVRFRARDDALNLGTVGVGGFGAGGHAFNRHSVKFRRVAKLTQAM